MYVFFWSKNSLAVLLFVELEEYEANTGDNHRWS